VIAWDIPGTSAAPQCRSPGMKLAPLPRRPRSWGLALALAGALAAQAAPAEPVADSQRAAQSGAALGVDLYHALGAGGGNLAISPLGISEMLALLSSGADGKTRDELLKALHWDQAPGLLAGAFGAQDGLLDRSAGSTAILHVANGLWYQAGDAPRQAFLDTARDDFRAEVRAADFVTSAPVARLEINAWVEQKTAGKIADLLPEGAVNPQTRLALANAVYFKGQWEHAFEARRTSSRPFFIQPGTPVDTPQMSATEHLKMAHVPECDLLELPYLGGGLSMVVLLPRERDGLAALEKSLTPTGLGVWLAALDFSKPRNTHVTLPKFRMTYSTGLIDALKQAGVAAAFDPREADFSPMNGRRDLHVSTVLHKAFVDVNEEGTEAAAATFVGVAALGIEMSDEFRADHPFIFLIRDNTTGCLLFLGRVADPRPM
jgi:serpin B